MASSQHPNHYKIGLGSKVLSRARKIFGSLLLIVFVLTLVAIQTGVQTGDFDRLFIAPFRQFNSDLEKAFAPTPTPLPLASVVIVVPSPTVTPTKKPTTIQQQPVQTPAPVVNCIRKNIREGEFASNKCYSQQDYEDLEYYLNRYSSSKFDLNSAEGTIKITCNCRNDRECEFFKDSCSEAQQKKSQAESDINKYRGIIQGIIAKGQ